MTLAQLLFQTGTKPRNSVAESKETLIAAMHS